jgi:hypothetical protein
VKNYTLILCSYDFCLNQFQISNSPSLQYNNSFLCHGFQFFSLHQDFIHPLLLSSFFSFAIQNPPFLSIFSILKSKFNLNLKTLNAQLYQILKTLNKVKSIQAAMEGATNDTPPEPPMTHRRNRLKIKCRFLILLFPFFPVLFPILLIFSVSALLKEM